MMQPRRNRVDPWGDLHAVPERGLFTGNRGCLIDDDRAVVRHHAGSLWIICQTSFRGWQHPLDEPRRWTPLFFLDDAVALAAGHRPCALCRREQYRSYRDAIARTDGHGGRLVASEINRRLAGERLTRGSGLDRARDRRVWLARDGDLPDGTVVVDADDCAHLLVGDRALAFTHGGWTHPRARRPGSEVRVLTPPTSVAALRGGFAPVIHPSAA